MSNDSNNLLLGLFARLLEYPASETTEQAAQCMEQLKPVHLESAEMLANFVRALQQRTLEKIQELYITTFDMQAVCYPYVGYHLFGESYKRGAFMAQLNEAYHASGYSAGQELPDHLSVILRFLSLDSTNRAGEFCQALLTEGVLPALEKMLKVFGEGSENPYIGLLSALHFFLVHTHEKELTHA
jgi:nitrate reductase delta subunit